MQHALDKILMNTVVPHVALQIEAESPVHSLGFAGAALI